MPNACRSRETPIHWSERGALPPAQGEPARPLPVHRGRVPVQARRARKTPRACSQAKVLPSERTRRFHYLARGGSAGRASVDCVRQRDAVRTRSAPAPRHLREGRHLGRLGVHASTTRRSCTRASICSTPSTSVSMTINGPAPILLAFFFNAAVDQAVEKRTCAKPANSTRVRARTSPHAPTRCRSYERRASRRPQRSRVSALLGVSGDRGRRRRDLRAHPGERRSRNVRGHRPGRHPQGGSGPEHVHLLDRLLAQGDGRHPGVLLRATTCATSTRCRSPAITSPKRERTRSRSSRSRSPTGSRIVEYYLVARDWPSSDFAPNFSLLLQRTGSIPSTTVIGRVARRIWADGHARALRRGRTQPEAQVPHPDVGPFAARAGDVLQRHPHDAPGSDVALQDACNSLHTNAYDEAVTTPTEESVRRALAIQLVHQQASYGLAGQIENPAQGSYFVEQLTDHGRRGRAAASSSGLSERGGVLGAMETHVPARSSIQDESDALRAR